MPSRKHRALKMTTTHTFSIDHPDKLGGRDIDIGPNRDVLEKMLPQFAGRVLQAWACPSVRPSSASLVIILTVTQ
jgi:hypothetical protein